MTRFYGTTAAAVLAAGMLSAGFAAAQTAFSPGNLFVANFQGDGTGSVFEFDLSTEGDIDGFVREITDPDPGVFDPLGWGPGGMAIGGPAADLYVSSILRGTITRFDRDDGSRVASVQVVPTPGPDAGNFGLRGMVWGPNGNLFVSKCTGDDAEFGPDAVLELDRDTLELVREIRQKGPATADCFGGIGFGPNDSLYVTGIFTGNLLELDLDAPADRAPRSPRARDGKVFFAEVIRDIDMMKPGEDPFEALAALTFASDGTVFVSVGQGGGLDNPRIGVVAPGAESPTGEIPVGQPTGIRYAANGHLFVGDLIARKVLEIDPATGSVVRSIGNGRDGFQALDARFVIFDPVPFQ